MMLLRGKANPREDWDKEACRIRVTMQKTLDGRGPRSDYQAQPVAKSREQMRSLRKEAPDRATHAIGFLKDRGCDRGFQHRF
jgi:hypothetical protein